MYSSAETGALAICLCPVSLLLLYSVHVQVLSLPLSLSISQTHTHTDVKLMHVPPSSQFEWDVSQANRQINGRNSEINPAFPLKGAVEARLRNQGRNYSCREKAERPASAEHCFYRRQANKQRRRRNPSKTADNSSGGRESQVTASFCFPPLMLAQQECLQVSLLKESPEEKVPPPVEPNRRPALTRINIKCLF